MYMYMYIYVLTVCDTMYICTYRIYMYMYMYVSSFIPSSAVNHFVIRYPCNPQNLVTQNVSVNVSFSFFDNRGVSFKLLAERTCESYMYMYTMYIIMYMNLL